MTKVHHTLYLHIKPPRRLYEMHDLGRNLRSQNLCSDTTCNAPDPHGVGIVKITNFWKQTDRVSPKTRPYPGLKPYKLNLQELQFKIYLYFKSSMATRRSHDSTGHNARSTQPIIHQTNVKLTMFSLQRHRPNRWLAHMALQSDSNNSFILEISYIFSYIFKYKLHIEDTCTWA